MINWILVGKIAGGGYGICICILVILSLVIWIIGLIVQKAQAVGTQNSKKG